MFYYYFLKYTPDANNPVPISGLHGIFQPTNLSGQYLYLRQAQLPPG